MSSRIFYRGTVPGETKRIDEPFEEGKGKTFVARKPESARAYGEHIEEYHAHPDAKILHQEHPEFWKLIGRRRPPNNHLASVPGGMIHNVNHAIRKAKEAGYHAVSFSHDSDVGTVLLDNSKFTIKPHDPMTQHSQFAEQSNNIQQAVAGYGPVKCTLGDTGVFKSEEHDVVYISVLSNDLHNLRRKVEENVEYTKTHPNYIPHITLAYVKPGLGEKYAQKLNTLKGREVSFDTLIFSDTNRNHSEIPLTKDEQFGEIIKVPGYGPKDIIVHHNPSKDTVKSLIDNTHHGLRGLYNPKNKHRYFWKAVDEIHKPMADKLGLDIDKHTELYFSNHRDVDHHYSSHKNAKDRSWDASKEARNQSPANHSEIPLISKELNYHAKEKDAFKKMERHWNQYHTPKEELAEAYSEQKYADYDKAYKAVRQHGYGWIHPNGDISDAHGMYTHNDVMTEYLEKHGIEHDSKYGGATEYALDNHHVHLTTDNDEGGNSLYATGTRQALHKHRDTIESLAKDRNVRHYEHKAGKLIQLSEGESNVSEESSWAEHRATKQTGARPVRVRRGVPSSPSQLGTQGTPAAQHTSQSLIGLPRRITIPGHGEIEAKHSDHIRQVAHKYMEEAGLPYNPPKHYAKVDPARAKRIAAEYDKMKHDPNHPVVKKAYQALTKETMAQWEAIKKHGKLKVSFIPHGSPDPYAASPRLATEDIHKNNHMWVFPTDSGFGSSEADVSHNPLLHETNEIISGKKARVNDIFRIVHDYFGHAKEGVGFRADGEENAWRSHSAMYSPLARRAMTTETRGQNSWVNFGPHGENNRKANTEKTVFADQKTGLLPEWVHTEGHHDHDITQYEEAENDDLSEGGLPFNGENFQYGEHPFNKSGEDLGILHHGSSQKIHEIDTDKLQQKDYGYYGRGFYVSKSELGARPYGRHITKLKMKSGSRILYSNLHASQSPELHKAIIEHAKQHWRPVAEARGKAEQHDAEMEHLHKSPIAWKDAVDRYARDHKYDAVRHTDGEIVVKNPNSVEFITKPSQHTEEPEPEQVLPTSLSSQLDEAEKKLETLKSTDLGLVELAQIAQQELAKLKQPLTQALTVTGYQGAISGMAEVAKQWDALPDTYKQVLIGNPDTTTTEGAIPLLSPLPPSQPPRKPLQPLGGEIPPEVRLPDLEAAVASLAASPAMIGHDYQETAELVKAGAFAITADLEVRQVNEIKELLTTAVEEGQSRDQFIDAVQEKVFTSETGTLSKAHLENIFRTNALSAKSDAKLKTLNSSLVKDAFPYARVSVTHDERIRHTHKAIESMGLDDTNFYNMDDPFFLKYRGPWWYQCRCTFTGTTVEQASRNGVEEAVEWKQRAEELAKVQGGSYYQYLEQTKPEVFKYVDHPEFQEPSFHSDEVTQHSEEYSKEKYDRMIAGIHARREAKKVRLEKAKKEVGESTGIHLVRKDDDQGRQIMIHPSTREPGRWQLSQIDHHGPWGHATFDTKHEALASAIGAHPEGPYHDRGDEKYEIHRVIQHGEQFAEQLTHPLDLNVHNVQPVWEHFKKEYETANPKHAGGGELAAARILNSVKHHASEYVKHIDEKVKKGENISDEEDEKYMNTHKSYKELHHHLAKISGYRPYQLVDEHPFATKHYYAP